MSRGTIKLFNPDRHFGFVKPDDGSADIFYHGSTVQGTVPKEGDMVFYEIGPCDLTEKSAQPW